MLRRPSISPAERAHPALLARGASQLFQRLNIQWKLWRERQFFGVRRDWPRVRVPLLEPDQLSALLFDQLTRALYTGGYWPVQYSEYKWRKKTRRYVPPGLSDFDVFAFEQYIKDDPKVTTRWLENPRAAYVVVFLASDFPENFKGVQTLRLPNPLDEEEWQRHVEENASIYWQPHDSLETILVLFPGVKRLKSLGGRRHPEVRLRSDDPTSLTEAVEEIVGTLDELQQDGPRSPRRPAVPRMG